MNLTIFGATGGTGQQLVEQAVASGHQIVAFVRDPSFVLKQVLDVKYLRQAPAISN